MTIRHSQGPRLFLDDLGPLRGQSLPCPFILPDSITHYLVDVLRVRAGEPLELCDAVTGEIYQATVTGVTPMVAVLVSGSTLASDEGGPAIHLLFALCKGDRNELVCDWATELGCRGIHLWQAARSVVRLRDKTERLRKQERFEKIVRAAAQQSKRSTLPALSISSSLPEALDTTIGPLQREAPSHIGVVCSLSLDAPSLASLSPHIALATTMTIAIGPEGDFTEDEMALFRSRGFLPISLGAQTLRSELAALTAVATINSLKQRKTA